MEQNAETTEAKPEVENVENKEKTPETPVTEPLTNGSSAPETPKNETPIEEEPVIAENTPVAVEKSPVAVENTSEEPKVEVQPEQLPVNGLTLEEKSEDPEVETKVEAEQNKPEEPVAATETVPAPETPAKSEVCVETTPLKESIPPPLPANPPPSSVASFAATTMAPHLSENTLLDNTTNLNAQPTTPLSTDNIDNTEGDVLTKPNGVHDDDNTMSDDGIRPAARDDTEIRDNEATESIETEGKNDDVSNDLKESNNGIDTLELPTPESTIATEMSSPETENALENGKCELETADNANKNNGFGDTITGTDFQGNEYPKDDVIPIDDVAMDLKKKSKEVTATDQVEYNGNAEMTGSEVEDDNKMPTSPDVSSALSPESSESFPPPPPPADLYHSQVTT